MDDETKRDKEREVRLAIHYNGMGLARSGSVPAATTGDRMVADLFGWMYTSWHKPRF